MRLNYPQVKPFIAIVAIFLLSPIVKGQIVYITENISEATHIVYFTQNRSQAGTIVYVTKNISEARSSKNIWYYTKNRSQAQCVIFITKNISQADQIIFVTDNRSEISR